MVVTRSGGEHQGLCLVVKIHCRPGGLLRDDGQAGEERALLPSRLIERSPS